MHFGNPAVLLLLIIIPLAVLLHIFFEQRRKKRIVAFSDEELFWRISNLDAGKRRAKFWLLIISLFFIIFAAARPQFGTKLVQVNTVGTDVVIAVDVSKSMLAQDTKPTRLEKAKQLLQTIANELGGNRIGVIAFAGTAFWQCPLTLDVASVNLFLDILDANLIPLGGTSIGGAIRAAEKGLDRTNTKSKAIILLTDGEDHKSEPLEAAKEASSKKIKIFTIGFGSTAGEPIPVLDENGAFSGYKKDKNNNVVMTKLDENLLVKIADTTGGEYFRAQDGQINIVKLLDDIKGLDRTRISSHFNREYEEQYQLFLLPGLVLLLIELFLSKVRKNHAKN